MTDLTTLQGTNSDSSTVLLLCSEANKANPSCEHHSGVLKHYRENGFIRCCVRSNIQCSISIQVYGYMSGVSSSTVILSEITKKGDKRQMFNGYRTCSWTPTLPTTGKKPPRTARDIDYSGKRLMTNQEFGVELFSKSSNSTSVFYCIVARLAPENGQDTHWATRNLEPQLIVSMPIVVYSKQLKFSSSDIICKDSSSEQSAAQASTEIVFVCPTQGSEFSANNCIHSRILTVSKTSNTVQHSIGLRHNFNNSLKQISTSEVNLNQSGSNDRSISVPVIFTLNAARQLAHKQTAQSPTKPSSVSGVASDERLDSLLTNVAHDLVNRLTDMKILSAALNNASSEDIASELARALASKVTSLLDQASCSSASVATTLATLLSCSPQSSDSCGDEADGVRRVVGESGERHAFDSADEEDEEEEAMADKQEIPSRADICCNHANCSHSLNNAQQHPYNNNYDNNNSSSNHYFSASDYDDPNIPLDALMDDFEFSLLDGDDEMEMDFCVDGDPLQGTGGSGGLLATTDGFGAEAEAIGEILSFSHQEAAGEESAPSGIEDVDELLDSLAAAVSGDEVHQQQQGRRNKRQRGVVFAADPPPSDAWRRQDEEDDDEERDHQQHGGGSGSGGGNRPTASSSGRSSGSESSGASSNGGSGGSGGTQRGAIVHDSSANPPDDANISDVVNALSQLSVQQPDSEPSPLSPKEEQFVNTAAATSVTTTEEPVQSPRAGIAAVQLGSTPARSDLTSFAAVSVDDSGDSRFSPVLLRDHLHRYQSHSSCHKALNVGHMWSR